MRYNRGFAVLLVLGLVVLVATLVALATGAVHFYTPNIHKGGP